VACSREQLIRSCAKPPELGLSCVGGDDQSDRDYGTLAVSQCSILQTRVLLCKTLPLCKAVLAFACVLYVIVDLDRAHEGLLRVSQQAMLDLQQSMKVQQP
jgi:hypothetical protein